MRKNFTYIHCDRCYQALEESEVHARNITLNTEEAYNVYCPHPIISYELKKKYELCKKCAGDFDKQVKEVAKTFCAASEPEKPEETNKKKNGKK